MLGYVYESGENSVWKKDACYKNFFPHDLKKRFMEILFPKQDLVFTCLQYKSFENTVGKGEIAINEQFLLFPLRFPPIWRVVIKFGIVVCKLFQFGSV